MKPSGQVFLAAVLALVLCLPAATALGKGKRGATNALPPLKNPMVFYLAGGEPNSCGAGCNEWIAAEGAIANGTAQQLRAFLKRHPEKRPIYFDSPGGLTSESIAMGRLLREREMTARVGRTIPHACGGDAKACAKAKRSRREQPARLSSTMAQCNSACVYTIVGAKVREIAPEAHLGIHASKTVVISRSKDVKVSAKVRAKFKAKNREMIRRYLTDMGIPPSLLDTAEKIPHETIRALNREEMVRFNIDTRRVVESAWLFDERISERGGIFKSIDITEAGGAEYRKTMLRLSCLDGEQFLVGYARELGPSEKSSIPLKFVAAQEEFKLTPAKEPVAGSDNKKHYDVRRARVPTEVLLTAAAGDHLELAPEVGDTKPGVTRLSTVGLASALSSLRRRCGQEASGGAGLVRRQIP
jgi:hypothetical protein